MTILNSITVIRKNAPMPLYRQVAHYIHNLIKDGTLKPGDRIPSEFELTAKYHISRTTTRLAITTLVNEGLVYRVPGKGTFLAERREKELMQIGLVVPHLILPGDLGFFAELVQNCEHESKKNNFSLNLCLDDDDPEIEARHLQKSLWRKPKGVIIYYIGGDKNLKYLKALQRQGIPFVLVDRYIEKLETNYVATDNQFGAYKATKYLIQSGKTIIYHISIAEDISSVRDRIAGYQKALGDNGILPKSSWVRKADFLNQEESAYLITKELLKKINSRIGIFAVNFLVLSGILRAIKESGIKEDFKEIALATFDEPQREIPAGLNVFKVIQPLQEIGRKAVQILAEEMKGNTERQQIVLKPTFLIENKK